MIQNHHPFIFLFLIHFFLLKMSPPAFAMQERIQRFRATVRTAITGLNRIDSSGDTPLLRALKNHDYRTAQQLIHRGASVNCASQSNGNTALMWAVLGNSPELVQLLIEHGADLTPLNHLHQTAMDIATLLQNPRLNELLIPLRRAIRQPYALEQAITIVLPENAPPREHMNQMHQNGWTPFLLAASSGHADLVRLMIEQGEDVNQTNFYGWTALLLASNSGHLEVVQLLLQAGANVHVAEQLYAFTALILAESRGHREMSQALRNAGATQISTLESSHSIIDRETLDRSAIHTEETHLRNHLIDQPELSEILQYNHLLAKNALTQITLLRNQQNRRFYPTEQCMICQESYAINDSIAHLHCDHIIHAHCLATYWISPSVDSNPNRLPNNCPICRSAGDPQNIIRIVDLLQHSSEESLESMEMPPN